MLVQPCPAMFLGDGAWLTHHHHKQNVSGCELHSWVLLNEGNESFSLKRSTKKRDSTFWGFLVKVPVLRDIRIGLYPPSVSLVRSLAVSIVSSSENLFLICLRRASPKQREI